MLKKLLHLSLTMFIIFGCEPNENEQNLLTDDTSEELPDIAITGLEANIEVASTINISIPESFAVEKVSVSVNQEEILNTNEKTFSFELNPFDYPNGENTLSIVAEDTGGNQSEESRTFKVNKLLVSVAAPLFSEEIQQVYFSVNTGGGELVAFVNVERSGQIINLYAEDGFLPQPIIVTSYLLEPNAELKARLKSISNIQPGTDLVHLQESAGLSTENNLDTRPNIIPFKITVTDIETNKLANSLFAVAYDHLAISENIIENPTGFDSELSYNSKTMTIPSSVIYTSGDISSSRNEEIISMEEYRYLFIDNPKDSSIPFSEFRAPESIGTITIPSNSQRFTMHLRGYINTNTFQNNEVFNFYESNGENLGNTIEYPLIDEFSIVRNVLNIRLEDGNTFEAYTLGLKDVTNIPDWTATRSGTSISMSGDYDKFNLGLFLTNESNSGTVMQWSFTDKPSELYTIPFDSFEFPQKFKDYASSNNISLSNFSINGTLSIEQFGSSKPVEYEEFIFQPFVLTEFEDIFMLRSNL